MTVVQNYVVTGMTCAHCVSSVSEEVGAVVGVTDVAVDLDSGQLTVTSETDVAFEAIEAAVDEAGYSVVAA